MSCPAFILKVCPSVDLARRITLNLVHGQFPRHALSSRVWSGPKWGTVVLFHTENRVCFLCWGWVRATDVQKSRILATLSADAKVWYKEAQTVSVPTKKAKFWMFGLRENTNTLKIEKACIQYLENVSKSLSNFKRKYWMLHFLVPIS